MERENIFLVLKRTDIRKYLKTDERAMLEKICGYIREGRIEDGKRINHYVCVADDWPEFERVCGMIEARVECSSGESGGDSP